MFDKETLGQLRGVVQEEVRVIVREEIQEQLQEIRGELKAVREDMVTREEVKEIVRESEQRVIHTVVDMVGTMIDDNILPQFDELRTDIASIKRGRWQLA